MRSFLSVNANGSSRQRSFSPSHHVDLSSLCVQSSASCRRPSVEHGGGWRAYGACASFFCHPACLVRSAVTGTGYGVGRGRLIMDAEASHQFRTRDSHANAPGCHPGTSRCTWVAEWPQSTATSAARGTFCANFALTWPVRVKSPPHRRHRLSRRNDAGHRVIRACTSGGTGSGAA